ncbi:MAG: heavy metal translocating P-type ATPase [Firmicutes bacterium]|nr:heavy metal translocating P-type ATPase [Bacillota bacterium]
MVSTGAAFEAQIRSYQLSGLDCANCAAKIEQRLQQELDPHASVNFAASTLRISSAKVTEAQRLIDAIEPGVVIHIDTVADSASHGVHGKMAAHDHGDHYLDAKAELWPLITAGVLFILGLVYRIQLAAIGWWAEYGVFLAAYLLVGRGVISAALRNLTHGQVFDENFLMTIATIGAFAIGELPEAVGVMLFYYVGELLQDMAVSRSRRSIHALLSIRPDYANLRTEDGITTVEPGQVAVGSEIVVRPGEKIPLDGEILSGESFVDTSALTGESVPRRVSPGETVLAGMVNGSGLLEVKVTKGYGQTSLARILDLVENAASRKAPTEKLMTKLARYYTPAVVLAAVLIAVIPPLVLPDAAFRDWLHRALVLLVISCPCALVISIPLGYFGGIGGASRRGILVKGANFLDALVHIDTAVFDKTGTLTEGVFEVQKVVPAEGYSEETVLSLAAQAEIHSSHPIALSIVKAAVKTAPWIKEAAAGALDNGRIGAQVSRAYQNSGQYEEIAGKGIRARINGSEILVGSSSLLTENGISFTPPPMDGFTTAFVAAGGQFVGTIAIADRIKSDATSAISRLRRLGVNKTVMLSGDAYGPAQRVAQEVGIDEVYAELLPDGKVAKLEGLLAQGRQRGAKRKLAYIGDGINDAPVLTRADVGIAMGGLGSDAAIEAADVVIMDDRPGKVAETIEIARYTRRIIIQNIVFAFGVKALFILLGIAGAATLWEAVFADVGVALLAVLNSARALRFQPEGQDSCCSLSGQAHPCC